MPIFSRNRTDNYSLPFIVDGSGPIGLTEEKKSDPSSVYFQYPDWLLPLNAPKLVSWLEECHQVAELQFIEPWKRHLRSAKRLVEEYGHDDLIRAVKRASQVSRYPFTFKFVKKVLDENI